ncbi:sulfatase family protein [Flammeovirga pacifica]|uniref:Sulfatase n=1 Tax=Flammeovirga pacifica TaxID=915059 RepID=A0A1S1YUC9_FLAPC|nr:sulfatase [Flammeovirga pacifica]OHX64630.1 sulfatase [Flammeovirga pacifica]
MRYNQILAFLLLITGHSVMAQDKPNVVWIMLEDVSLDMECYGMKGVQTPQMNALAQEGTLYYNCFGTASICSTNRSAMILGTHQRKTNTMHHRSNRNIELKAPFVPFTYLMKKEGYTSVLGHSKVKQKGKKTDFNFKYQAVGDWEKESGVFDKVLNATPEDQPFVQQITLNVTHRGDWWDKVSENSKHPVHPDSIDLPEYYADHPKIRTDWAKYLDMMEAADKEVGIIVQELKNKGMYDNTAIIIIGDNGRCNVRGKGYLFDPALRIPLIVKWPKNFNHSGDPYDIISSPDITATILDLGGVDIPEHMTGRSFIDPNFDRKEVFSYRGLWDEIMESSYAISTEKYRYIRNDFPEVPYDAKQAYLEFYRPAVHVMRGMHEEGKLSPFQASFYEAKPVEELYDLENDPEEKVNLAQNKKYKKVLADMRNRCADYKLKTTPVDNYFEQDIPVSVAVLQYLKDNHPEEYERMKGGDEIGFYKFVKEYKKLQEQTQK